MPLPVIPLATGEIDLAGQKVQYRAISAAAAFKIDAASRATRGAVIIALALDISEDEAQAWLEATPMDAATELLTAIVELSGLEDEITIGSDDPKE